MTILVIDDEEFIRTLAERILQKSAYQVLLADSGQAGVDILKENSDDVALAIIDMSMIGLDGCETLKELRMINPVLPGIISSGHAITAHDLPPEIVENTFFLQKPYRAGDMLATIDEILRKSEAKV